jgi:molecular chaperone HscB
MDFQASDFEIFGVSVQFTQDIDVIESRWRNLQKKFHPDKFANEDATMQRLAVQWSARINEAYRRLRDPLLRANYLCELRGNPLRGARIVLDSTFLQRQIEWHEALDELTSDLELTQLSQSIAAIRVELLAVCAELLDCEAIDQSTFDVVHVVISKIQFIENMLRELDKKLALLQENTDKP